MTLPDAPVVLPRVAFAKAWDDEKIGQAHPVIGVVDFWVEDDAADTLNDLIKRALAEVGFYDLRRGRVMGTFRDLMLAIAHAPREVYGFSSYRSGTDRSVLAVPHGRDTVTIVVSDDVLTIDTAAPGALSQAVIAELPHGPAADIGEIVVPQREFGNRADDYSLDTTSDYTAVDPAEQLRALMSSRRTASHQLYAAVRAGGTRRSSVPLTALDTDRGRVLTYLRPGQLGDMDIVCGPGEYGYMAGTLDNTLQGLHQ